MIQYGHKGSFHASEAETEQERLEALATITEINSITNKQAKKLKAEWKITEELKELNEKELTEALKLREEAGVFVNPIAV